MSQVDLLLVNPSNRARSSGDLESDLAGIEPPLWCGLKAAFIREKGYSVEIIDACAEGWSPEYTAERIIERKPLLTDIVVLGTNPSASSTPKMPGVRALLTTLKNKAPETRTVLSGLHPSALPERTLDEEKADFICQGTGFSPLPALLDVLKSGKDPADCAIAGLWFKKDGKTIARPPAPQLENLDELPFAAWDLLPMEKYRAHNWHCFQNLDKRSPYAVIYTSLGCPFNCDYCPNHSFYGKPGIWYRSPENVIEEIDLLVKNYNIRNIKFMDELFVLKKDRVDRICDIIIERDYRLNIWVYARLDTVDERILRKMKRAGINWIAYGVESASAKVREGISKRVYQEKLKTTIEMTKDAGIYMIGNFIFGLPDDDRLTMRQTLDSAKRFNFEYVNFYVCMAYPGSNLYDEAVKSNVHLPESWAAYGQYSYESTPLPTKYLTSHEVLEFRDKAFVEYFSEPAYLNMIEQKFGQKVVHHIQKMLKYKIKRKYAEHLG